MRLLSRSSDCAMRKRRRKIGASRVSLSTPTKSRDLARDRGRCECVRRVHALTGKGRLCVLFRRIRVLSVTGLRSNRFTWRYMLKTSRDRDIAALNFRYAHAGARDGARKTTHRRLCRFPEVPAFGVPRKWRYRNNSRSRAFIIFNTVFQFQDIYPFKISRSKEI